jgi:hypothetical protein
MWNLFFKEVWYQTYRGVRRQTEARLWFEVVSVGAFVFVVGYAVLSSLGVIQ